MAAAHAAELGARTVLVSQHSYGGMAANDRPVPVRTLAHTAYLMRNARQLGQTVSSLTSRRWITNNCSDALTR